MFNVESFLQSSGGSDGAANAALLAEKSALSSRVAEQEEQIRSLTEEKNVTHRQLGQLKEQNAELEEKVKVGLFVQLICDILLCIYRCVQLRTCEKCLKFVDLTSFAPPSSRSKKLTCEAETPKNS